VRRDKPAESVKLKYFSIEVLATHSSPESCVAVRKGSCEALIGEWIGQALLPEIESQMPTLGGDGEGNREVFRFGKERPHLAGTKTLSMSMSFLRENREAQVLHRAAALWRIVNPVGARR
jgi:hypothetical protein